MTRHLRITLILTLLITFCGGLLTATAAENRFPRPEFESGYVTPEQHVSEAWQIPPVLDIVILLGALGVAAYLGIWARSRRGLFFLTLFGVAWFGFFRAGCVCPIGAIQNVALAGVDPEYVLPWVVLAFFALPLIFAAFVGRSFCAGVCPLGAIQDVFLIKPMKMPKWLGRTLEFFPYVYLGAALLFVVTGAGFLICRYDPFIGFYRMDGPWYMLAAGGVLLALGTVYGRPYCRFLCPYGVILGWLSKLNWKHVKITPTSCITCHLCEDACPFDAILPPKLEPTPRKTISRMIALIPVFMLVGIGLGLLIAPLLAKAHPDAFTITGEPIPVPPEVLANFQVGTAILGAFLGFMAGVLMLREPMRKPTTEYTIDPVLCVSCARCFTSCPKECEFRLNMKGLAAPPIETDVAPAETEDKPEPAVTRS